MHVMTGARVSLPSVPTHEVETRIPRHSSRTARAPVASAHLNKIGKKLWSNESPSTHIAVSETPFNAWPGLLDARTSATQTQETRTPALAWSAPRQHKQTLPAQYLASEVPAQAWSARMCGQCGH